MVIPSNGHEAAKQDTSVGQSKIFSDAMRSSAIRMSDDAIEAVAFFMNVDVYKTFVAFASRLKGLLNYYLDSRYITDVEQSMCIRCPLI